MVKAFQENMYSSISDLTDLLHNVKTTTIVINTTARHNPTTMPTTGILELPERSTKTNKLIRI